MEQSPAQSSRSARWAPVVAVVAVVAVIAVVTAVLGSGGDDEASGPPPLKLASESVQSSAGGTAADSFMVASSMLAGSYRLEGQLPTDGPERGRVHRLTGGQVDEAVVRRLAAALGLSADPRHADGRWTVSQPDEGATLEVTDEPGNPWWFGSGQQVDPMPVEPLPGTETGGTAPALPADDPVDEPTALAAARPVLDAVERGDDVRTEAYGGVRAVVASQPVEGLPTQGLETRLEVGADGRLLWASGMLGDTTSGEEYPLVSAQQAYDLLVNAPHHVMTAMCAPDVPCGPTEQVITGARPGLQLHLDEEGPLLVPAWLFTLRDLPEPVGHVAVDPKHLWTPDEPDVPVAPPAVAPDGTTERTTFGFDRVARGVQDNEVIVGYGDSGSCPHRNVTPLVQETDDAVMIRLEADAYPPDTACTDDYLGVDLTVPLERPLGDRVVVDETSGTQHPLP